MDIKNVLVQGYGEEVTKNLLDSYMEIENYHFLEKWKLSELDGGHFVEAARRAIEFKLTGSYPPFNRNLPRFTDQELQRYEQFTGDESYRILIPRALKSIYNIRNKRGVGHVSLISPNKMDSTYILFSVKWVLAELLRLTSGLTPQATQHMVDSLIERKIDLIWKECGITRVLNKGMAVRDQILILLYDQPALNLSSLKEITEYKNKSNFKKLLIRLHQNRLIEFGKDEVCQLSPLGKSEAEKIINLELN